MPKTPNQKLKLLYLAQLLYTRTDEDNGLTIGDMIASLAAQGITADRRTVYSDLEDLRHFGLDIVQEKDGRHVLYHLVSRRFELAELKLLVDTVQCAKFITPQKSRALIRKIEGLTSENEAKQLHRQVILAGRIKGINESIYYNVDTLHAAIEEDRQISFLYTQWDLNKKLMPRYDGKVYRLSPWALVWDNEYYYLIAYDDEHDSIRHYRVDKMLNISLLQEPRGGREVFAGLDLPRYSRSLFGMFSGESAEVTLECRNDMIGVILDRFGTDVPIIPADEDHFRTHAEVTPSPQFFGWLTTMAGKIRLTAPQKLVDRMRRTVTLLREEYGQE